MMLFHAIPAKAGIQDAYFKYLVVLPAVCYVIVWQSGRLLCTLGSGLESGNNQMLRQRAAALNNPSLFYYSYYVHTPSTQRHALDNKGGL
jgi:hypothetical protein